MKRIAFLDYVRVFACLLVMVVHASENFYGAAGTGEMAGPQSLLQNEADRFWVSLYDGFSRMSVPLFMIISAYLLVPLKEGQSMWQFYRRRFLRVGPPPSCSCCCTARCPCCGDRLTAQRPPATCRASC